MEQIKKIHMIVKYPRSSCIYDEPIAYEFIDLYLNCNMNDNAVGVNSLLGTTNFQNHIKFFVK